jgi:hypothetical protein
MRSSRSTDISSALLRIPTGILAMRIFLWLVSLLAAYGLLQLVVSASQSVSLTPPSASPSVSLETEKSEDLEEAIVCSMANQGW